jgi:hypothetical protein
MLHVLPFFFLYSAIHCLAPGGVPFDRDGSATFTSNLHFRNGSGSRTLNMYCCLPDLDGDTLKELGIPGVEQILRGVDSVQVKRDLERIYGVRHRISGTTHLTEVKQYIFQRFVADGLQVTRQEVKYQGYSGQNIIAHLGGQAPGHKRFLLTAHYDAVSVSPGADDDGSGVAGILAAADILSKYKFKYSVDFVAFDLEEESGAGSKAFLDSLGSGKDDIAGVLNIDMIGHCSEANGSQEIPQEIAEVFPKEMTSLVNSGDKGDFVLDISNESSKALSDTFGECVSRFVPSLPAITLVVPDKREFEVPGMADGDHGRFWQRGCIAIFIGEGGPTRNPYYHSKDDKLEYIDYTYLCKTVKAIIASAIALAEPEPSSRDSGNVIHNSN